MNQHEKINYVEFPCRDIAAVKGFFTAVFNWKFEDYGPDYTAFSNQGLDGGFYRSDKTVNTDNGSALIIFYSEDLHATKEKVIAASGQIIKPIFDFPGGQRFHFSDPSGNEFAVWGKAKD
ncbi:MAG: VOC family protein [Pseudomonadales bacterium]|nr:VOC family protein [Pseudomonadales bacterium]